MDREAEATELLGLRVLVVEDVAMLAWRVRGVLTAAGAEVVGPVPDVPRALALLDSDEVDAAVLDMNLNGETAEPIADALVARGVPFLFLTGYAWGDMEGRHAARPALGKPVKPAALVQVLADLAPGGR
ncbi:response regulator [Rhodopila sp.]|uniref:response regulator n=1 Tax=Rhodopila sp. TaxID=2480087 RepID=UPI003D11C579